MDEGAVEENLGIYGEVADCFLEMGHQEHVSGFVVLVVEREVVYLAQVSSRTDDVGAVLEEVGAEGLDEGVDVQVLSAGSYFGI